MKNNLTRYSLIVLLMGLIALTADQADAQDRHRNEIMIESLSWGMSSGQVARIGVVNVGFLDGSVRSIGTAIARIQLLDTEGEVIAESDEIEVAPGKTRFWDVPREQLPALGPRVQVRGRTFVVFPSTMPFDVDRDRLPLAVAVELVDAATGRTDARYSFSFLVRRPRP